MRRLLPDPGDVALEDLYAGLTLPAGRDRPWVALGMVSTVDGAASIDGDTAQLGGDADGVAFRRLRDAADAILVGAGTVRDEDYGPPTGTSARRADRRRRGLTERPRMVIVSGSLSLDVGMRIFGDPASRPIILTGTGADDERGDALQSVADIVRFDGPPLDLRSALDHLFDLGITRVLCEGGPALNGWLLTADLVDEIFVTIAPVAVGGSAPRIIRSDATDAIRHFNVTSVVEHRGELIVRYCRTR